MSRDLVHRYRLYPPPRSYAGRGGSPARSIAEPVLSRSAPASPEQAQARGEQVLTKSMFRRTGLVLTLGLSLFAGSAGVANAGPTAKSGAAACPVSGQRFQVGNGTQVYL